jgi:hypothetical protein
MARKIQDFGEKIGGARKDVWRHRGLQYSDISCFNTTELLEHVTKKNVWIEPKWKQLRDEGYSAEALYVIKHIRDSLPAKPEITTAYIQRTVSTYGEEEATTHIMDRCGRWIEMIIQAKNASLKIKTVEDTFNVYKIIRDAYEEYCKVDNDIPMMFGAYDSLFEYKAERRVKRLNFEALVQHFPDSFRGDFKGLAIYEMRTGWKNGEPVNTYVVGIKRKRIAVFDTEEDAKDFCLNGGLADTLDSKKKTKKTSTLVNVVRPQLEHIERFGPDLRQNVNVTGDDILKAFKFRGGEFGNWNSDDDRQACLNYVFDALSDLMYCMDTEIDFIGLGKTLKTDKQ